MKQHEIGVDLGVESWAGRARMEARRGEARQGRREMGIFLGLDTWPPKTHLPCVTKEKTFVL